MAWRIAKWTGLVLLTLVALLALVLFGLDTQPGRRLIADRLAAFSTESGMNIRAGRIDGSIYGRMVLSDVQIRDPDGIFVTSPRLTVDWRPLAYFGSGVDVRSVLAPTVTLLRKPRLLPTDPNAPTLPDIDLALGKMQVGRLIVMPAVTGRRHAVAIDAAGTIADGRAQIRLDAAALRAAGVAGGDRLHLMLDAVPDANRFALDARLTAPSGGLVDSYARLGRPLDMTVGGHGDWAHWRGQARGTLGGQQLADLAVQGASGTFRTTGLVRPGLALTGPAARLVEPAIRIDLTTALADRKVDVRLDARSSALAVDATGRVDLADSRFGNFRVAAQLLRPGAVAPNVRARDLRISAVLDGPFATPTVDYRVTAAAIGFGTTGIDGLAASGKATIDTDRILVPVHATARAATGLNAAAGGLLTNLRLDGTLAYQDGKVATDDLRVRSDRIDATAILLADIAKGTYTGALKGRVNDYQVNGLGRVDLTTDAQLVPGVGGGFAVKGRVRIVTRSLDSASVRAQLGGNAVITANIGYDLAGGATISDLRLAAPKLRITSGRGFYRPDGRLELHASAQSAAYGPIQLDVTGTVAKPVARLRATRPDLGLGLAGLDASLVATGQGYRVRARGQSAYGPLTADVTLSTGGGRTRFDIASATFAGINFGGHVAQTAAGPFAGVLTLTGAGLNGEVRLAAAGSVQRADIAVRAASARIPGPVPVTIGSGTVRATVLLPSGSPSVTGDFVLANLRSGAIAVARARGRIDYVGGSGRIALVASGDQAGAPFDLATQAQLSPSRILANLTGTFNGIAVRLARPAVATKTESGWQLTPLTLVLPQGQVDVSGSFGGVATLRAVLRNLDLSIVNAFVPGFGLGGKASGIVDYTGRSPVPDVRARIDIANFTRTAALTVSRPVDIALLATLDRGGGDARVLVRRGGAVVGRAQVRLAPLGGTGALAQRLAAAPLSGGIRYNGPAETLWALSGIARQSLTGPVAIGADLDGTLGRPRVTGVVRADALRYENETYGTVLTKIAVDGRFTRSELLLDKLTAAAGDGTIAASGRVGLDADGGFPIDVRVTLDKARLARGDDLDATASGTLAITNSKTGGGLIKGDLTIPDARYQIVREGSAAVAQLSGVRRKGAPPQKAQAPASLPSNWKLDIRLRADNRIFVSGMGLEAEWRTDMRVAGTSSTPTVIGRLEVVRGTYSFAGRRFDLDRGVVTFQGGLTNPELDIAASTTVEEVSASINIGGYAQNPRISFSSTPALPQDEVLSRLLFGSSVTSLSPTQAIQLAAALNSLRGSGGGGLNPLGKLRSVAGIDRLRVLGADDSAGRGTALAAGKYISNDIYVEIVTDARGFTATQLEVSLSKALSVLSQTGSFGGSNVSVRYKKRY